MRIEGLVKEDFLRGVESLRGGPGGALEDVAALVEGRAEDPISAARQRAAAGAKRRRR